MSKLIMLSGLPCSGKSTYAEKIISQGNWMRLNRDLLREMLHFSKWSSRNEGFVVDMEKSLARSILAFDYNVVIDDTNLNPKNREMWSTIAKEMKASFEHIRIGENLPIEELVARDRVRTKFVGGTVIKNMALQYGLQPIPDKGYVIVDIDGTIADCEHRRDFVRRDPKDWKGFFDHMSEDTLRKDVAHTVIDYYNKMHTIIYVTGRPDDYKTQTLDWLKENNMSFGWTVIMRRAGDTRPDTEVKQEIYDRFLKKYPIEVVIDDRPSVVAMWRSNGLKVKDVGKGINF